MRTSIILQIIFNTLTFHDYIAGQVPLYNRCFFGNNEIGICVYIEQCPSVMELYNRGTIRSNPPTVCSHVDKTVCCPLWDFNKKNFKETSTTPASATQEAIVDEITTIRTLPPSEISIQMVERKCREFGNSLIKVAQITPLLRSKPIERKINKCLHSSVGLIVGGTKAMPNEFPHQALLGYEKSDDTIEFYCGGSLVSPKFVLTVAHCIEFNPKVVKLGMYERFQRSDKIIDIDITNIYMHPNFYKSKSFLIADIALVELQKSVQIDEYILPICLPTTEPRIEDAIVTGFGKTENDTLSNALMKVTLERFNQSECQSIWKNISIDERSMICYGHHTLDRDSCRGDSGSPIQISNEAKVSCTYTQLGIVSFGRRKCGQPKVPGIYTNVYYYLNWIVGIVWKDEL